MYTILTNVSEQWTLNIRSANPKALQDLDVLLLLAGHVPKLHTLVCHISLSAQSGLGGAYVLKSNFFGKCINDRKCTLCVSTLLFAYIVFMQETQRLRIRQVARGVCLHVILNEFLLNVILFPLGNRGMRIPCSGTSDYSSLSFLLQDMSVK